MDLPVFLAVTGMILGLLILLVFTAGIVYISF